MDVRRNVSGGGNFAYLFQVAADANAMQIVIDTTLYYPFCPISVCWLSLNFQPLPKICLHFGYQKCFYFVSYPFFRTLSTYKSCCKNRPEQHER